MSLMERILSSISPILILGRFLSLANSVTALVVVTASVWAKITAVGPL